MRLALALAAAAAVTLVARAALAENCVDKDVWRAQGHGHPCMDVGSSMGRGEVWTAPSLLDVRVSVLRLGVFGNDDARRGTVFELATWEALGEPDDGLEHPRDFGKHSAIHALGLRRQIDRDAWGAYVGGDAIARFHGHNRFVVPRVGVRVGRFDRAAAVVEARFSGGYLVATAPGPARSFVRDFDVGARTTYVLTRRLRLESRARYRDVRGVDGRELRDVYLSVGVEGEVSPPGPGRDPGPNTWRVLTLYAGVGLRRALVDVLAADELPTPGGILDRAQPAPPAPWELMFTVDVDVAINSELWIW